MHSWCRTTGMVFFALASPCVMATTLGELEEYSMPGEEAPVYKVVEQFLAQASTIYSSEDHEFFEDFCKLYSINSTWPSTQLLGTAFVDISAEYAVRLDQAAQVEEFRDLEGQEPTEWRSEAFGRAFGEIFDGLRTDGFKLDFRGFLAMVEHRVRGSFTSYSDKPFDEEYLAHHQALFWRGAVESSYEAEQFVSKRGLQ